MKTLWFKQIYQAPILSGEKTDTVRRVNCKLRPGDTVGFSIGPRPPFAHAYILEREEIKLAELPEEHRAQVAKLYGESGDLCRLTFRLVAA